MNGPQRLALIATLIVLVSALPSPAATNAEAGGTERLSGSLDLVLLLDKSLSMAPFFDEVKTYAAGEVLGPILSPGDRLIVELVYGKVERLYAGTIASEADKAAAIRSLRAVRADGPFTDLGAALDVAARDIKELGQPERPKYVLLLSDERQEAPDGSPYRAADFKLRHPYLEYVKRVQLGRFRAITIGLQVGAKVEAASASVLRVLSEPPSTRGTPGAAPSGASGTAPSTSGQPAQAGGAPAAAGSANSAAGQAPSGAPSPAAAGGVGAGSSPATAGPGGETGSRSGTMPILIAGIAAIALAAAVVVPLVLKNKRKEEEERRGET